jgi:GAF domain-containing protein
VEPLPATREALARLSRYDEGHLASTVEDMGKTVATIVPQCVGLSLSLRESGITLTVVATSEEMAALDAVQYVDGGPCVEVSEGTGPIEVDQQAVVDEDVWQMYAQATAAAGVRSSLSLPILRGEEVIGAVNMYASTAGAFEGHVDQLAAVVGGSAEDAITNADLSFSTRLRALEGPTAVADAAVVDVAVGVIMEAHAVDAGTARERLRQAAARAGITQAQAARTIISGRH